MGCQSSKSTGAIDPHEYSDQPERKISTNSTGTESTDIPKRESSRVSNASSVSQQDMKRHHERLRRLQDLDAATKIPFICIELRGVGDKDGYIEVCGKDEYGVYHYLEEFFIGQWRCQKLDAGDLSDDTPLPFCDALYRWEGFMVQGSDGTNNMGLATMQLVDFMCGKLSWTLGVVNGGNVGKQGEIREQQVIFKAPHPMNLNASHIMVELRSAGVIEVCGGSREAKDKLHNFFTTHMNAKGAKGHQVFSDRYYECGNGVFQERGKSGENNLGLLTTQVCDNVVKLLPGWTLVTMNGGNYGEGGTHREQQLVFREDNHPLGDAPHLLVELREAGYIEVCGENVQGIYNQLGDWLSSKWGCKTFASRPGEEPFCNKKYTWRSKDMMVASAELTDFFHGLGWRMEVCSQGTVAVKGNAQSREQQILFRPGASIAGHVEPHIFLELYTGEGEERLYSKEHVTQVNANQFIRIRQVGDCRHGVTELEKFLTQYLGGRKEDGHRDYQSYAVDVFLSRGLTGNNLGCWTMRLCDFMVDRLGWTFVVCNVCNLGPCGQFREQQLVFRYDGERREIPPVKPSSARLDECLFVGLEFPNHWKTQKVLSLKQPYNIVSCTQNEVSSMQEIFDSTFKRVLTRDRVFEYQLNVSEEMPYRLEIVHMFRCEHAELYRRYMQRKSSYKGGTPLRAKTLENGAGRMLNERLQDGEALLAHGTNPSSAMGILKNGFSLSAAGKSTGTMFGYGIYLAECVSKSDEYARDDNGGTYPGLMAMLMCRSLVGNPYVVQDAGDYIADAKRQGMDCVVGDRESKVGTYREFIFFDERQILPEYTVIYKRVWHQEKVPSPMRQQAKGTTGRNWQLKLDKGWANLSPDVSFELTKAEMDGKVQHERLINDILYVFDFAEMTQRNMQTGTKRQIRPPMRRDSARHSVSSASLSGLAVASRTSIGSTGSGSRSSTISRR
jgi:hypothetical protein